MACDSKIAFFVELKGTDLLHAVKQIDQTMTTLAQPLKECSIYARIVLAKNNFPDLKNNPSIIRLRNKLKKQQGSLVYQSKLMVETLANPLP
ncbi:MAG: hypothetical protein H7839_07615 [Magnetococcus sp. YQC-5]